MDYRRLISAVSEFGSTPEDICENALGVSRRDIRKDVILAPFWKIDVLDGLESPRYISTNPVDEIHIWDIGLGGKRVSYVRTGIGSPVLIDPLLALGLTDCRRIILMGSVGAITPGTGIGDIVVPEYAVAGDGASRYIASDDMTRDVFGEKVYPDHGLTAKLLLSAQAVAGERGDVCKTGRCFSVDTIVAQFAHLEEIRALGCDMIEMEAACAFRAARLMEVAIAGLFIVTDNSSENASLMAPIDEAEKARRRRIRREAFPEILRRTLV